MASCRWWVSTLCNHSVARKLLDSALVLPGSQLSATVWHHALFFPFLSLLPCFTSAPAPRLACQLRKPPPHCQPDYHTQKSLPPRLIQVPGVSCKSQPAPDTCPRNTRVRCRWSLQIHCLIGLNKEHISGTHKASCCNINLQKEFCMWHFLNVSK